MDSRTVPKPILITSMKPETWRNHTLMSSQLLGDVRRTCRRICVVGLAFLLLPQAVALGEVRSSSSVETALERLESALGDDRGLDPGTRSALQGLVAALKDARLCLGRP